MKCHDKSDEEVIELSRSLQYGCQQQREMIAEAKRRGIFDGEQHLRLSPIGQLLEHNPNIVNRRV